MLQEKGEILAPGWRLPDSKETKLSSIISISLLDLYKSGVSTD